MDRVVNFHIMFFYVYIINSQKNNKMYVGYSSDLRKRIEEHNSGKNKSTKIGIPWRLVYYEACLHEGDAYRREKYLKTSQGMRLIKSRIKEYLYTCRL